MKPTRTLGTAGMVLGILALFPLGALAGVPAVVLSVFALREEPRSRGRATAGVALGSFGIVATIGLVLAFATLVGRTNRPGPKLSKETSVTHSMYSLQGSLWDWSCEHGAYPAPDDFDSDSSRFMKYLARDRVG